MEYFRVRYDSRVVIYERKMFKRLATGHSIGRLRVRYVCKPNHCIFYSNVMFRYAQIEHKPRASPGNKIRGYFDS